MRYSYDLPAALRVFVQGQQATVSLSPAAAKIRKMIRSFPPRQRVTTVMKDRPHAMVICEKVVMIRSRPTRLTRSKRSTSAMKMSRRSGVDTGDLIPRRAYM